MSNSGNTLSKKTIAIIVIIAILLVAAIVAVVVFLRDQGQTSAMAENDPQSVAEEQNAEPEQQSTPEEQSAETPSTDDGAQIPTDVASVDDATTEGNDNAGTTTTPSTTGTTGGTSTTGNTQNAGTTTTDANNIQESVIEETQTTYDEERVKVEEGEILSWTPEAPLTVLVGMANNMKLNAPKLVTDKTSVVVNKDGTEAEDQTKVDLTQKIKYIVTIENLGNVAGVIEATDSFDVIPEGLDLSSATDLSVILTDAEGNTVETEEPVFDFSKDIVMEGNKVILKNDITLEAGQKLELVYALKVNPDYLKDGENLVASKDITKNIVTINNVPVEDDKEYDAVEPIIKAEKTSVITRDGTEIAGTAEDPAKVGDIITYTIHIENNGGADTTIKVKDNNLAEILTKADFLEASRSDNVPVSKDDLLNEMEIMMYHETSLDIVFKVQLKDISGIITNGITVTNPDEENPDPDVDDPDEIYTINITAEKHADKEQVKEKEEIKYTITLTNTGNTAGSTVVKDTIPEGTTFKAGSIEINGVVDATKKAEDLANGITVNVPANNGTATVAFVVTANVLPEGKENATIKNTAIVGEGEDEEEVPSEEDPEVEKSYVSLTVNKAWVDNEIQSAQRQDVTFELTADGIATGETKELQEETTPAEVVFEGLTRYAEDGHEIAYSVKEVNAGKFYNSAVGATTTDPATGNAELTVTNTFKTPEEIKEMTKDYTVTKVWEDENNKAEKRTNVTLIVSGNGESTKIALPVSKEEFANNQWQGTVTMPQYNANGEEIVYTAQEETVPQFYTASANGLTVKNTFVVPTDATEVKINKTWEDNDIQKQRRPDQIKFTLEATLEDGTVVENVTRNGEQTQVNGKTYVMDVAGDNQTYTFTGLPVYDDNANAITYDVEESVIDGEEHKDDLKFYNSSKENIGENNIQFTNTFKTPEEIDDMTTKIPVTKVWEDNDDKAEKRPSELKLVINGTNIDKTISYNVLFDEVANSKDNNTWTKEINVQQYDNNGQEIAYTLTEPTVPDFYTEEIKGMTVVNTFVGSDEQKTINVTKVWDDNNNNAGKRPGSIQFTATGTDTTKPEDEQTITKTTTLSASSWTGTITVPKYDGNANEIEYTVSEQTDFTNSKFYQASDPVVTKDASGFTTAVSIKNTFAVPDEDVSLTVNKTWVEENATQAERRPGSIRFTLQANGVATGTSTDIDISKIFEDKDYSYTFTGLDRYDELGNPIDYTVEESKAGLEFYTSETTGTETDTNGNKTVNVTNTFTLPEDNVKPTTITKVWMDNNNEAGKRPTENITLELTSNDGETTKQDVVVPANNTNTWEAVVDLPTYNEDGVKIEYILAEPTVPEFYQSPIVNVNEMTVTNTFKTPEQIEKDYRKDITITKVWEDNNDAKNARPENVTFNVIGKTNGTVAYNKPETIQEDLNKNTWTKTVNVPVYDSLAREISYTVQEANIPNGYVAKTQELTVKNILPGIEVEKDVVEVKHGETTTSYEEGFTGTIPVEEGDIIKYNISVRNTSSVTINNVTVTDDTLAVTANSNGEDGITPNIGIIENLLSNETKTYTVYHKVTAQEVLTGGTKITNTVTVTGKYNDGKDTITEDDDATVTVKDINDISVVKEQKVNGNVIPNGTEVKLGQKITYTITVTNEGNTTLKDVVVNDTISGIAGELNIKPTAGVIVSGDKTNGYVFTIGELPARATKVITAEYTVIEADISENSKEIGNVATVNAKTTGGDPVDPETSEVEVVTEEGEPIIDVVKTSTLKEINGKKNDNKAEYGDIITYTITATNTGIISGDVTITDKVPTGTELYRNGTTNLTAEELNALETEAGLTKVLNVAPNGGESKIIFSVKVIAKPGEDILNTATVNNDGEITEESDNGNDVEKTVSVTAKSQTSTIKNSNVVIVLDVSGSMDDPIKGDRRTSKINKAKDVVQSFINSIDFAQDGSGSAVSVITFSGAKWGDTSGTGHTDVLPVEYSDWWNPWADPETIANTPEEARYLANTSVENISTGGGTCISGALQRAKQQVDLLNAANPDNKTIVIFVGDGEPDGDGERNKIGTYANNLKAVSDAVYSIGFETDVYELSLIASKPENYKTTSDDLDLSDIFSEVVEDLGDEEPVDTVTENGIIELTDIDTTKKVKLVVRNPEQPATTTEELISAIPQIKQRADGTYYLDVTEFEAGADISIQYVMKE